MAGVAGTPPGGAPGRAGVSDLSALILAGSRGRPEPVALAEGVAHKSLIEVGGQPILERVIGAVRDAGVSRILVAADEPDVVALARRCGAEVIAPQAGPSASVAAGFAVLAAPMLVTTSDHALLRPDWIRDFVAGTPAEADVAILLARRDAVERALPGTRRTWLRFADGQWSGCNLFLLAGEGARNAILAWQDVEANRKRPWRIAARLGLGTLISYATGRLALGDAVIGLGRRLGVEARIVAARDGLAAIDVDKEADLADVRRVLDQRM